MSHAEAVAAGGHDEGFERARMGMWLFLASEVMMFGAFIAVYIVLRMANDSAVIKWSKGQLSVVVACVNTAVLILSSYTMVRAVHAISKDDRKQCKRMLLATAGLGALFLILKIVLEYVPKVGHGITPNTNVFFGCYYLLTGFHGFHVLIGVLVLAVLPFYLDRFGSTRYAYIENTGLYWHFVDLVWIFLFPIVYLL